MENDPARATGLLDSLPAVDLMQIAFDATTLRMPQTGVGYYSEHLLRGLLDELGRDDRLFLLSHQPLDQPWSNLTPRPAENAYLASRGLWLQLRAPRLLRQLQAQVAHFTNSLVPWLADPPLVVTVHDMSVALFPGFHPWRRRLALPLVNASMRRARKVITVSDCSRRDILRCSSLAPSKVEVIYAAAASQFRPITESAELNRIRHRYSLPESFLLFVGTFEPRKNLPRLVEAFLQLPETLRRRHPLVLAGAPGWGLSRLKRDLERSAWGSQVRLLGYVPYEDLPCLHNLATAFVFPSLYEGFGLPVVEAMACGTPVVTSSTSSLQELFEKAALLIDPEDTAALRQALQAVLESRELRSEYSEKGLQCASRFSWRRTARQTLEVYRQLL